MALQTPRNDSSAASMSTVSFPALSQPTEPRLSVFNSSTTPPSPKPQPVPITSGAGPGPANEISQHRSRWGWILRYPIVTMLSIVLLLVLLLVIVMTLTLNGDVQQLYGQIPYNKTGVSPSGDGYGLKHPNRLLTLPVMKDRGHRSQLSVGFGQTHVVHSVGDYWLRRT